MLALTHPGLVFPLPPPLRLLAWLMTSTKGEMMESVFAGMTSIKYQLIRELQPGAHCVKGKRAFHWQSAGGPRTRVCGLLRTPRSVFFCFCFTSTPLFFFSYGRYAATRYYGTGPAKRSLTPPPLRVAIHIPLKSMANPRRSLLAGRLSAFRFRCLCS